MMKPIISPNIRIRVPDAFEIGEGSIVDDFSYFSTQIYVGKHCHIANNVSIAGGRDMRFELGDYSSVSSGARIWCRSDDFRCDLASLMPPGIAVRGKCGIVGDVILGAMTIVGANSVIMPDNEIPEGVAIGALSFVPTHYCFRAWGLYAGIPIRFVRERSKDEVMRQRRELEKELRQNEC